MKIKIQIENDAFNLFAKIGNRDVGYLYSSKEREGNKFFYIIDLIRVDKKYRHQGIATKLINVFLRKVHGYSVELMVLSLDEDIDDNSDKELEIANKKLIDFYSKFGFKIMKGYERDISPHMIRE